MLGVEVAGWAPEDMLLYCSQDGQPVSWVLARDQDFVGLLGSAELRGCPQHSAGGWRDPL